MERTALGLSLLGNELKAVSYRKLAVSSRFEGTAAWEDADQFAALLREIIGKTQPDGRQIALVLAHPRLSNQLIEIPPVKGATLQRLLDRQAQAIKAFPGPAAWSAQPTLPTKKSPAVLLHLLPRSTLNQLLTAARHAHVQLARVLPTTSVLASQLKALPLEKDQVALVAAETGGSTTVVIGRKDGKLILGRVLPSSWANTPDRVWVDLTRSIGFAEQQSGMAVSRVYLFGANAQEQIPAVQSALKIPVEISPVEFTPSYWAEQAARLPSKDDANLVTLEERQAPQRQRMLTVTGVILLIVLLLSLAASGVIEVIRQAEFRSIRQIDRLMTKLQAQKSEWDTLYGEAARKKELVRLLLDEKLLPVPALFLGYLGEAVSDNMVLSDLRVVRTNQAWSVHFSGAVQGSTNPPAASVPGEGFLALSNNLVTGPFRLHLTNAVLGAGGAANAGRETGPTNRFVFEGTIR